MIKQNPKQTPSSSSDSEFSRDLENHSPKYLSPTTVETLHTTSLHLPPSLLGKGVRGLGFALAFPQKVKSQTNDSGFTIIESLVGILIAAILLAAISPVLVMSTAIRVQSRRIEKATQAANTFIEGVRTGSIKAPSEYSDDNKIQLDAATADEPRTLAQNLINLTTMPLPDTKDDDDLYLFKQDGSICHTSETGCTKNSDSTFEEFYIQARQIIVTGSGVNDGYRLAIRD